ncbi:hypothetical protein BX600DRAFT_549899 [Xylariales sp. PMI_506]|nr:hypothetical protein BX600DRAFT_549899 [Xylariales sp. PMI_506]
MADSGDIVSYVALIVSIIAFIATVLQVLQQYYASATGYANCNAKVMGEWARYTKRVLKPYELRFEVQYEAPVIFLASANNQRRPIPSKELWYISGTDESYKQTRILLPEDAKLKEKSRSQKELIHTADNERATWLELLSALQNMERQSDDWQKRLYLHHSGKVTPPIFANRTLAVAVQGKTKSWDTMPSNMTKPYATTAMCHLVELTAVLGLHWKEFSRDSDRFLAEGNGYMLTGSSTSDLGLVFSFQRTGMTRFEENRVIPVSEVKQLCFGFAPTIFCDPADERHLEFPGDEPKDLTVLQLGSTREIAETLMIIGCNKNTASYFLQDGKKTTHLFPIAFEILGMLGRTLHASGSGFRMLPNPTIYHWDKKSFSMWKLLKAFKYQLTHHDEIEQTDQVTVLERDLEKIFAARGDRPDDEFTVPVMDAIHETLDDADTYLTEKYVTSDDVMQILRRHFQEIMIQLNEGTPEGDNHFADLDSESPEHRQARFIEIYFDVIRPKVVLSAANRRQATFHHALRAHAGSQAVSPTTTDGAPSPVRPVVEVPPPPPPAQPAMIDRYNNIWCTLVLRTLCWLLLHDFHKKDVQLPRSELFGSRLPVYIA